MKTAMIVIALVASAVSRADTTESSESFNPRDLGGVWIQQERAPRYGRIISYTPEYAAIRDDRERLNAAGTPFRNDRGSCIPRGIVGLMTTGSSQHPIEIFQTGDRTIAINMETVGSLYRIFLSRSHEPAEDQYPRYFGDSVGRWEGNVLVVDTVSLGKLVSIDAQAPVSDSLHVVQRLQRISADTLRNELTLTDTKAFTEPLNVTVHYKYAPDVELHEVVCENERDGFDEHGNPAVTTSLAFD